MARILLIEDEDNIRRLISYDLKSARHEVVSVSDGLSALETAKKESFDAMIIDWMLPGKSGIELIREFRAQNVPSIMMMLTAKDEEGDILEAFEAGCDDYMTKPFSPRELLARLSAHLKRFNVEDSSKKNQFGDLQIHQSRHEITVHDHLLDLTKKEYDLLVYFVKNAKIVCSRDTILNEIWDFDYDGDTRIVDVHIFKLRHKLKDSNVTIRSIRGVGYVLEMKDE